MPPYRFIIKLLLISIIMMMPAFAFVALKWPATMDYIFYSTALKLFSAQIFSGEIYPRWLMNANYGLGSPIFLFYPPISFYIASLFEFISDYDKNGFLRVLLSMLLAIFISGITTYRWLKSTMEDELAQKMALLYASFPYMIIVIYVSYSPPQLWSLAFLPLLLKASQEMTIKGWRSIPKLGIFYALLALTHLPTTLVFCPIPIIYTIIFTAKGKRIIHGAMAGFSAILGVGLSAICLIPTFLNKTYIGTDHFTQNQFNYQNNFLNSLMIIGFFATILPLFIFYWENRKSISNPFPTIIRFWLIIIATSFFMITPLSLPIWSIISPLQYLQFPWRFYNAIIPAIIYVIGYWMTTSTKLRDLFKYITIVYFILFSIYSYNTLFIENNKFSLLHDNNLIFAPEYNTVWENKADIKNSATPEMNAPKLPTIIEGKGNVSILSENPRLITIYGDIESKNALVSLKRLYFTGWQTNNAAAIEENSGMLAVRLPNGESNTTLQLKWFDGEYEGILLSSISLIIFILLTIFSLNYKIKLQ